MPPIFIEYLKTQLNGELPGKVEHQKMLMSLKDGRKKFTRNPNTRKAAVLILLYKLHEHWNFFLTKRSETVEHHKGQVSLPGGEIHKSESHWEAAQRETYEEIGVQNISYLGSLTPLLVPVSNFYIYPFVGWVKEKPTLKLNYSEVSKIFQVSVKDFIKESILMEKSEVISQKVVKIPFFSLENEMVWGATAALLNEFRYILKRII